MKQKLKNLIEKQNDILAWIFYPIACLIISGIIYVQLRSYRYDLIDGIYPYNSAMTVLEFWIALLGNASQLTGLYLCYTGAKKNSRKIVVWGMIGFVLGITILQYLSILKDLAYHYIVG
ncbi:MAG: hypothetical protein ACTSRU_07155 [Candidatus Hodarchaeales archaeon]